ncbi:hypothetical protein [Acetivibrio clariflavus]|uniref:hypothetical protein n=1 Tax=Acetivibrio clariflavus TaxID=288965 RepID=UPI0003127E66|nr:hypothetical protein [Acetivibrio clariflavus]
MKDDDKYIDEYYMAKVHKFISLAMFMAFFMFWSKNKSATNHSKRIFLVILA